MSDSLRPPWTVAYQAPHATEIFQARGLEWVAISFPRVSSWPSDQTWVSRIAGTLHRLSHQGSPSCRPSRTSLWTALSLWAVYRLGEKDELLQAEEEKGICWILTILHLYFKCSLLQRLKMLFKLWIPIPCFIMGSQRSLREQNISGKRGSTSFSSVSQYDFMCNLSQCSDNSCLSKYIIIYVINIFCQIFNILHFFF